LGRLREVEICLLAGAANEKGGSTEFWWVGYCDGVTGVAR